MNELGTKLTRITLQGFKSFRRKISIPFFDGFVCICGPNGCGKSNIADAISFALGRSSAKSLRADRLHELIYHGHDGNPPADYAAVTLWFDNSKKIFPFDEEEVAVTRKVNKQGMSLFKINGSTTTREKILELLSAARIHPDGFNIIMQGDVTQVIEMDPEERRGIIDEIAGIKHYNEKKEKALANLEKVEQKLKEVEIVISERMERLVQLENERNTALKYKDLQQNLERLRASLAHKRFSLLNKDYETSNDEVAGSEEEIQKLENEIREIETGIEQDEKRKEYIADKMFVRSRESSIRQEIGDIKNKILRNETKVESNERETERINSLIQKLESFGDIRDFSKGVKVILNLKQDGVYGVVGDLIKVSRDYETAIEVAGGNKLQNIVVENSLIATECINYLKRERLGRATFLPLNRIKPRKLSPEEMRLLKRPGVVGSITNLIKYDRKFAPAIEHVFGDTIIVENLGVAREIGIGKIRMVTLDGDLAERSGAMIGGYYQKREMLGHENEIREYVNSKRELEEENNFLKIEIDQLNRKIDDLRRSEEREAKEVIGLEDERTDIDKKIEELKLKRKEKYEIRIIMQNKINKLKIKSAKMEAELENYKLEAEKYGEMDYIDDRPEILEVHINNAIRELNSLGLVNLKAIEEYDAFKLEFDELKNKFDKINEEKSIIQEMIRRIEEKKMEVFYETLKGIDKNFKNVFKEIAGGESSLELEDPINIESGLLIQVSPGGKNLVNIDAMSGGEKSLAALAFLFGVQLYKPSPFYILDEVDAFLDKSNTKKIVNLVKKLSKEEQFIMISHNDYTIKEADKVYGITLEDGESKILGLELPQTEPQTQVI